MRNDLSQLKFHDIVHGEGECDHCDEIRQNRIAAVDSLIAEIEDLRSRTAGQLDLVDKPTPELKALLYVIDRLEAIEQRLFPDQQP